MVDKFSHRLFLMKTLPVSEVNPSHLFVSLSDKTTTKRVCMRQSSLFISAFLFREARVVSLFHSMHRCGWTRRVGSSCLNSESTFVLGAAWPKHSLRIGELAPGVYAKDETLFILRITSHHMAPIHLQLESSLSCRSKARGAPFDGAV